MCDTDSVWFSAVTSTPLYLIGVLALLWKPRHPAAILAGFGPVPLLAWQVWITCRIVWAVNATRGCACWTYQAYPMEDTMAPSARELLTGPLHLATAFGVTSALMVAWLRRRTPSGA